MRVRSCVVLAAAAVAVLVPVANAAPTPTYTDENFAGFGLNDQTDSHLTVTATFVVPHVRCGKSDRAISPDIGIQNAGGGSLAGIFLGCHHGNAHFWPTLAINGARTNYRKGAAIHAGDTVALAASENATKAVVSVVDKTRRLTRKKTGAGASPVQNPWLGEDAWFISHGKREGVPNFGRLRFSHGLVDGAPFGSWPGGMNRWDRETAMMVLQIRTASISKNREGFSSYFEHS
jgi:hypothetical protein